MAHTPGMPLKPRVVLPKDPGACWPFTGTMDAGGYGKVEFHGKTLTAHRWLWLSLFGPLDDGMVVAHTCGTRNCINPHHLRACSQAEANRAGVGATLTPMDVAEIRRAKEGRTHHTADHLATRYGVSRTTIFQVWGRQSWGRAGQRGTKPKATKRGTP